MAINLLPAWMEALLQIGHTTAKVLRWLYSLNAEHDLRLNMSYTEDDIANLVTKKHHPSHGNQKTEILYTDL